MDKLDKRTWKIIQRIAVFVGTILILFFVVKFAVFFMPFLVAGILAIIIEPIIKFCMNKLRMSRRTSSIIIVSITVVLFCLAVFYGGVAIVREVLKLTSNITPTISNLIKEAQTFVSDILKNNSMVSEEVVTTIENSIVEFINNVGKWIVNWATGLMKYILSIPTMIINIVITILALIFFTKDRIYMIDLMEHHFPKKD